MLLVSWLTMSALVVSGTEVTNQIDHPRELLLARAYAGGPMPRNNKLDRTILGKGCSFCIQANFNFKANFDKLSQAIGGVASDIHDVENTLAQMSANFTKEMAAIAHGIEDLAKSVSALGADMLLHLVAMRGFLNQVKAEIDLGILVTELQQSIARITHRQSLLEPLYKDKQALSPQEKQDLVSAILDINQGSSIDTEILHDVMTGTGGIVPGIEPAMNIYMKKGYRIRDLAKVYGALFVYQMHGYGQLLWAYLNKRPAIELMPYNATELDIQDRLMTQWIQQGSPYMWHCYWDDGFVCPERQECYGELRSLSMFTCNYAVAPVQIGVAAANTAFTLGASSSDSQLEVTRDAGTGTCVIGVRDCTGSTPSGWTWPLTNETNFTCSTAALLSLSATGVLMASNGTTSAVIANLSTSNHSTYALFVSEQGTVEIIGDNKTLLWNRTTALPPSGPCPTEFLRRSLQPITYDSCKCITTARWRRLASSNVNVTASWCGRLCQADPQYVVAAPRANGECWCGTPEVLQKTRASSNDCESECIFCPGAPIAACGANNSVAIYTWKQTEVLI